MNYIEFKRNLHDFSLFSLADIRKIDRRFDRRRLNEWQKKGFIRKLRRGYYLFADTPLDERQLFLIANRLYTPSYVSFEMALSWHGLIPEAAYMVTSASTRKTAGFQTPVATFTYHKLHPRLFFGYDLEEAGGQRCKIASVEKAVLDYLYLHPEMSDTDSFEEWRLNRERFRECANFSRFADYLRSFANARLTKRAELFVKYIHS